MADRKESSEFLGGGPKFNTVGRDNRSADGEEVVIPPADRSGYWLRVAAIVIVVVLLTGLLLYVTDRGKTTVEPNHRSVVSPDNAKVAPPSNF